MRTNPTQKRRLGDALGVPDAVLADAVSLYRELEDAALEGVPRELLPAAVLYIAVRQHGVPRSIDEIASAADVSPVELYRGARRTSDALEEGIPPVEPEAHLVRLVDLFELDPGVEARAFEALAESKTEGFHVGRKPPGVAAAVLYAVLDAREGTAAVTQRELSEATGVHIQTLRKNYQQVRGLVRTDTP